MALRINKLTHPPNRLRDLPESTQRQFDFFYEWILRLNVGGQAGSIRLTGPGGQGWTAPASEILRTIYYNPETGLFEPASAREQPFDTTYSPSALWGLHNQTFTDLTGNGFTLTVESGTERWTYISQTMGGFLFDGATVLIHSSASNLLGPTGDMTYLGLGIFERPVAASVFIAGYDDVSADADPNNNTRWSLFLETNNGITFISESGAGVNATHNVNSYAPPHQLCMYGFTRASGVVQHYLNGRTWGAASAALTTPDGGSNSRLRFGGREGAASCMTGVMASMAIYPRALTEDEIAERWNYVMGRKHGFITADA